VLTSLWLTDEFNQQFQEYLNQLNPMISAIFSMSTEQLKSTQGAREEVMKLFYILRGIMRGLHSKDHFALFFDWFYPDYFSHVVEGALNAFFEDDEVTVVVLKFLTEMVFSRNNRLRFDTWTINGLIVFKETAKYLTQLLKLYECLKAKTIKPKGQGGDLY
jgi:hypothetical protein